MSSQHPSPSGFRGRGEGALLIQLKRAVAVPSERNYLPRLLGGDIGVSPFWEICVRGTGELNIQHFQL